MTIGIYETEHFEGAFPVIKLFDTPDNQLVIFTTQETWQRFADLLKEDTQKYQWVILDNQRSRFHFFIQLYRNARQYQPDIFYINTISNNHLFFAAVTVLLKKCRIVITLHDINCMLSSRWSWNPRILAHHLGKKWLTRLVKEFNVVSDTMVPYLKEKTAGRKIIHNVPGAVYEGNHSPAVISDYVHLVIPGSIDKKRRNYDIIFELLQFAETKRVPVQLTILGGYHDAYGKSIVQKAAAFTPTVTRLKYYDTEVVHQDEFDRQLNAAHFIFIPSVIDTAICHGIPETYGQTKSSGNIFDVIKHAKPFIVPAALTVPANLKSSCIRYTYASHLLQLLQQWLLQPQSYQYLEQEAINNSMKYTIPKIRKKNAGLFQ